MAVEIPVKPTKPIVFISSAIINLNGDSSSLDYFVQILALLSHKVNEMGADLIVKIPKSNQSDEQSSFIDEVYKKNKANKEGEYAALIISSINEKAITHALKKHIKSIDDYKFLPVFTIDKFLSQSVNDIQIPYVTSDWEQGGECAAQCIIEYVDAETALKEKPEIDILVLYGLEGSEPRVEGFQKKIRNSPQNNQIKSEVLKDKDKLNFTREGANKFMIDWFDEYRKFTYDVIFACNDEMALGAQDYILKKKLEHPDDETYKKVKIVGFDGTKEFLIQLDSHSNQNLLATIGVQIDKQVDELIKLLVQVTSNIKNNNELNLENIPKKVELKPRKPNPTS